MLKLLPGKTARRFLDSLPPKQFRQIMLKILRLLDDPKPHDSKPMTGHPFLRNDVGEYRIIYDVQEDTLRVLLVGKRNDDQIYKEMENKL